MGLGFASTGSAPPLLWARDAERGGKAAQRIGRAEPVSDLADLMARCDAILLAVADDAIADLATRAAPLVAPGAFVFHASGRSGAAILSPLAARGARVAAIHPAMTFTGDPAAEVARMAGARFAITGDPAALGLARQVVVALGGVAVPVAEESRALYHAALCHGANHLVTLIAGACDALRAAGVDDPAALLAPLAQAALGNGLDRGMAGLSGPLLRGDADSIARHVAALGEGAPDLLPAYRAMALATLDALDRDDPVDGQMRDSLRG